MYPVMLDLANRRCLVVGGGGVALRKVQGLVEEGARVTVVAPDVVAPLEAMAAAGEISLERRRYRDGEAAGYALVFAATDDREVNARVFRDAEAAGIWVNVADDPELCSFHLPARVRRGPLQLAIGSAGEAPFAVRRLRQLLERRFGSEWGEWLEAAARFRNELRNRELAVPEREALYDRFFAATVDGECFGGPGSDRKRGKRMAGSRGRPSTGPTATSKAGVQEACRGAGPRIGFVSLVGAGPGCPGLLTVRGRRRLAEADAVVYDRLAAGGLAERSRVERRAPPGGQGGRQPPDPPGGDQRTAGSAGARGQAGGAAQGR